MQLKCIKCDKPMSYSKAKGSFLKCSSCKHTYKLLNGIPIMRNMTDLETKHEGDWLDKYKSMVKKYPGMYSRIVNLFAPVYSSIKINKKVNQYFPASGTFINIGSGNKILNEKFINFDYYPYDNVNIVGDAKCLPFQDGSVDAIINVVVLEHIDEPELAIAEMYRVLKRGGVIYSVAPFIVGYHASPTDYKRWTMNGLEKLHDSFVTQECGINGGPTSAMLWIAQEWLAMLLSFGFKPLYKGLLIIIMLLTWPLKYLDIVIALHPMAKNIASSFYIIANKPDYNVDKKGSNS